MFLTKLSRAKTPAKTICKNMTLKRCSKTLHISHGRGVVAAIRRNQFDRYLGVLAIVSRFRQAICGSNMRSKKLVLKISGFGHFSASDLSGSQLQVFFL